MASAFKNAVVAAIGTTLTDVYTAPALTSTTIIGLSVANVLTTSITVSVSVNKGGTVGYVVKDAPVPTGGSLVLFGGDQKLVLETGNKFSVVSSAAASASVIVSVLEIS